MYCMCAVTEKAIGSSGAGVTVVSCCGGCWEQNLDCLQELQVLLTCQSSPAPNLFIYFLYVCTCLGRNVAVRENLKLILCFQYLGPRV